MNRLARALPAAILAFVLSFPIVFAQSAPVRVVLFYSPTCPHCHKVIEEDMPPILERYSRGSEVQLISPSPAEEEVGPPIVAFMGDELELLYVNTSTDLGYEMFDSAIEVFEIPADRQAVPTIIVGSTTLLGDPEIPEQLPVLIEEGLAAGGVAWPAIAGLADAVSRLEVMPEEETDESDAQSDEQSVGDNSTEDGQPTPENGSGEEPESGSVGGEASASDPGTSDQPPADDEGGEESADAGQTPQGLIESVEDKTMAERFMLDPAGNSLSVIVLIGMVLSLIGVALRWRQSPTPADTGWRTYVVPALAVFGVGVAGYLAYVESSGLEAACGPVGNCNAVQQSVYAELFGIPIGILGLVAYVALIAAWFASEQRRGKTSDWAAVAMLALSVGGVLFSIYLTFLEPFVIGATCIWCLSSAVLMTLIMWAAADPAAAAWQRLSDS